MLVLTCRVVLFIVVACPCGPFVLPTDTYCNDDYEDNDKNDDVGEESGCSNDCIDGGG